MYKLVNLVRCHRNPAGDLHYRKCGSQQCRSCKQYVDIRLQIAYTNRVIKTFKSKELSNLFASGKSKIDVRLHKRILLRLDTLDLASSPEGLAIEGYNFHALRGFKPTRYTIHINGPWCITFEFSEGHALQVDLEQYH